ncbi:Uncharacterized protein CPATCC_0022540 [Cryptosporidium parvum]|uniref:Uncharacterized protein n=1 Tax=Cryptosporidium parvum TaxID=5807 RepID=A0A7S7LH04_CRYPV|nr:Uncharacterized protein CPATCC_0022540 [Cryptosporidium parvum]|eukprot:QOY41508.1 hypothetical protein CPATCC_002072 [Cryptosporidium parvum]
MFKKKLNLFLSFILQFMTLLIIIRCTEKNKATHVRVQDRIEPIKLNLDDKMIKNYTTLITSEAYQSLSNYPIWEDTSDTDIIASKENNFEENNAKEDYDIKRGFIDLAKNITHVYGNMIQSNLVNEFQDDYQIPEPIFDENPEYFSFPYQKDSIGNEAKILDGLNKTKNAVNLGKNITVIKQDDREMLRNAFPEDFSVNSGEEDFTNQSLNSKNVEELLKETRANHQDEHERIQEYLQSLNITSPKVTSKVGDLYDSYILLSASAQEYNDIYNNTLYGNKTKQPFSIPLKPYYIWEGIDNLWDIKMSKTTTPSPKTREALNKIDNYNSFIRWKREEPFRVYDMWYDAVKERKDGRNSIRREAIKQRDRVLEEKMNKQRAFYSPAKEKFDDIGNATELMAGHIDKRFGQLFNEVTEIMDKEAKEREHKYYEHTFKNKMEEFCSIYPNCCINMSQCPEFVYNYIQKARILF